MSNLGETKGEFYSLRVRFTIRRNQDNSLSTGESLHQNLFCDLRELGVKRGDIFPYIAGDHKT